MNTFYLKHDNADQLIAAMEAAEVVYDYIGIITKEISEGSFLELEGFHANVLCEPLPDSLVKYQTDSPKNPVREFFK